MHIPALSTAAALFSIQASLILVMIFIIALTWMINKQTRQIQDLRRAQTADSFMHNQIALVRMTLDARDDAVMDAWGDWPDGLTPSEKRVFMVQNVEMTNLQVGFENGVLSEKMVRESIEETFGNLAGQLYWHHAGPRRKASSENENPRTRRFHEICAEILDDEHADNSP